MGVRPARRASTKAFTARLPPPRSTQNSDSDDDDEIDDEERAPQTASDATQHCCADNNKALEDYMCDCIRPPINFLLGFFSMPTSWSLIVYYGGGAVIFRYLENWTIGDTFYFLTVTATTVGYGDISPVTPLGRACTIFFSLYGIAVVCCPPD